MEIFWIILLYLAIGISIGRDCKSYPMLVTVFWVVILPIEFVLEIYLFIKDEIIGREYI